ncbi:unannotated protein [freshwater metagenome]|uniref:Unannotated protein n=1 Tax=freshwater metagenome TaxID=449393 RepID=A0A6J6D4A6_9ZZZZ
MTAAVILSGGQSARFGSDKSRAKFGNDTLLERAVTVAHEVANEVLVVGPWAPIGTPCVVEPERFGGPLSALAFALEQVSSSCVLVLAGDHPLLQSALLRELLRLCAKGDSAAVVPVTEHGPQPLVACYDKSVLADAKRLIAQGERSMRALLSQIQTSYQAEGEWTRFDPEGWSFLDVDTPGDLGELLRSAPTGFED